MKKILKKLRAIDVSIKDKKSELRNAKDPLNAYYDKIASDVERQRDIKEIQFELKDLLKTRFSILENLQKQINKEKFNISNQERKLSLVTNK